MSFTKRPPYPARISVLDGNGRISKEWDQYFRQLPNFSDAVVPAGTIDGANKIFTLPESPNPPESFRLRKRASAATSWTVMALTTDYTLSGKTLTYVTAPAVGDVHECDYRTLTLAPA